MTTAVLQDVAAALAAGGQPGRAFAALDAALASAVGHRLFTVLVLDERHGVSRRFYSSNPKAYPVSGEKPIRRDSEFYRLVVEQGRPRICHDRADIRSGALRPLAHTWPERIPSFPDIPTFRELGFADLVVDGWSGIAAPARTPRPILERLAAVTRESLEAPDVVRRYAETATAPGRLYLDDAQRFVREELTAWTPIIRASGASVD